MNEKELENNVLTVSIDSGSEVEITVIDIVDFEENGKTYIVYSINGRDDDDIFISILNESDDSYSLDTISDEQEFRKIQDYIIKLNEIDGEQ